MERCPEDDGCWSGSVFLSDEGIQAIEPGELTDLEKRILLESGVPDLMAMASDDPAVSRPAMHRWLRNYLGRPCPRCGKHAEGHSPGCRNHKGRP